MGLRHLAFISDAVALSRHHLAQALELGAHFALAVVEIGH
jgi:hypothetical protein